MNNLYGWGINGYLPYGWFKCIKNADEFDVNSIGEKTPMGYVFEVDLEYPDELHALHSARKNCNSLLHSVKLL